MRKKIYEGQIGLILLVVVGLVVGLIMSIASRSISDSALSRKGKENNATFSVAESGIEMALQALANGGTPPEGKQIFEDSTGNITGSYEVTKTTSFELYVKEGESAQIDLTEGLGSVLVNWVRDPSEKPATCIEGSGNAPAALEITLLTTENVVSRRYYNSYCVASGSCSCNLTASNSFGSAIVGLSGYLSGKSVVVDGMKLMRLKPIYNGATIRVTTGNNVFNSTLFLVQSSATGGDANKEIEVKRSPDTAGSVFDYALFSGGVITKP